ncbi:unnamed protein product [Prorocentrum cordatum]|uniref:Nucleoside-diphosphate kinase n=1 Tax=Prorocentrum cordatum TaxID=2364126 RepID=A0ABN9RCM9_9DINO|nr:unnamed protein product [Polarella glacialis]
MVNNSAFVFLKPLAVTEKMKELVKKTFEEKNIKIVKEGSIEADTIDKKQLIDKHYYAIASKATLVTPDKLTVPADKFKGQFGVEWDDVLKEGKALNAKDACEKFEVDADGLNTMWGAAKKAGTLVKLGGGFYCAKLEKDGKGPFYVFNGFFMTMRSGFVKEGASIYYYVVEWDPKDLPWADFRGKVLGPTDPADAPKDSLRGGALAAWEELGLPSAPNTGENCCHASASPFEGLAERMNWLGYKAEKDAFGKALLAAGVKPKTIKDWTLDPQVQYGPKLSPVTKSIWDTLEDMDSQECLDKCAEVAAWRPLRKPKFMKVADEATTLPEGGRGDKVSEVHEWWARVRLLLIAVAMVRLGEDDQGVEVPAASPLGWRQTLGRKTRGPASCRRLNQGKLKAAAEGEAKQPLEAGAARQREQDEGEGFGGANMSFRSQACNQKRWRQKNSDPSATSVKDLRAKVARRLGWPARDLEPREAALEKFAVEWAAEANVGAPGEVQGGAADDFMPDDIVEASQRPGSTASVSMPTPH